MKAMVLAAGRGERMRPLTDARPKPLLEVGGRPLIAWHLAALARAGIAEVIINLSWRGEQLRAALGDGAAFGVRIRYSEEGAVALETGGGIFQALPLLGPGPFLVVNGDVWTDLDFGQLALERDAQAHLVLVPNPPQHPRGDFALQAERVTQQEAGRFTYSGIGLYRPEFFSGCTAGKFPLLPLLTRAIAAGQVRGHLYPGQWWDVGTPQRLAQLDQRLRALQ
jgi:MurNAc alpha-1-phosphate uridylyltransferase